MVVRPTRPQDLGRVTSILTASWGGPVVVSRGVLHDASTLPGFIAELDGEIAGVATYDIRGDACELVTIDALVRRLGIGSALIEAVVNVARERRCRRVWLITTNDNLDALRFYLRVGFRLVAVRLDAVTEARRLKPSIPLHGAGGVEIRDEWELELLLDAH